jgi:enoyl-CoA hydratase/carnithine racemase
MITLKHIDITLDGTVAIAHLNRPHKANALNQELWFEIEELANWAHETAHVRVVILSARGTYFCAGIDFSLIQKLSSTFLQKPNGRRQEWLFSEIQRMQRAISALERCDKPILAAINGLCVGGGVDLICACDMRYAVTSADFCIKEVDLAIVADIGTIQRLPTIVGEGIARELTMTARTFGAQEALSFRLLNNTYSNQEEMMTSVLKTAHIIA